MVSETFLGVAFCFLLPFAIVVRFMVWYPHFKQRHQLKLQQSQDNDWDK